jgi:hypothetical protein
MDPDAGAGLAVQDDYDTVLLAGVESAHLASGAFRGVTAGTRHGTTTGTIGWIEPSRAM